MLFGAAVEPPRVNGRLVDVGIDLARTLRDLLGPYSLLPRLLGLLLGEGGPLIGPLRARFRFLPELVRLHSLSLDSPFVRAPGAEGDQGQNDDHGDGDDDPHPRVHDISPLLMTF